MAARVTGARDVGAPDHERATQRDRPVIDDELDALVARADLDELVRLVDRRTAARDWPGLARLRDRCRAAIATGRQLWPATTLAEYRLALWAPAEWAVQAINDDGGRFTIGPLTEVVAQHHTWAELAPHLEHVPASAVVAHERVLRGENLAGDHVARTLPDPLDLPLRLAEWEPQPETVYSDAGVTSDPPAWPGTATPVDWRPIADRDVEMNDRQRHLAAERIDDADVVDAVRQLVAPWVAASNGRVEVVGVAGPVEAAVAALGVPIASSRFVPISSDEALAWLAWAGASGGAHGRRRGGAAGRFAMWWLLAAIGDLLDEWPPTADEIGEVVASLQWAWWDAGEPPIGWQMQLAVHDPVEQISWAISARDSD